MATFTFSTSLPPHNTEVCPPGQLKWYEGSRCFQPTQAHVTLLVIETTILAALLVYAIRRLFRRPF